MVDIKFSQFFDRPKVMQAVKDGTKSSLSKAGAFVRRSAKGLIRSGKKSARPGSPPKSHTGRLKDFIFFGYDDKSESVVVGPKQFRATNPTGAHLLEFGGVGKSWRTGQPATYRKFPFMEPALKANEEKIAGMFSGAIKG